MIDMNEIMRLRRLLAKTKPGGWETARHPGTMSPPLPDADNDEETAHTFDTREARTAAIEKASAVIEQYRAILPGLAAAAAIEIGTIARDAK